MIEYIGFCPYMLQEMVHPLVLLQLRYLATVEPFEADAGVYDANAAADAEIAERGWNEIARFPWNNGVVAVVYTMEAWSLRAVREDFDALLHVAEPAGGREATEPIAEPEGMEEPRGGEGEAEAAAGGAAGRTLSRDRARRHGAAARLRDRRRAAGLAPGR